GLAAWPGMIQMHSLNLSGNDLRWSGLRMLLRSPQAGGLKELVLRAIGLNTGEAMQEFDAAPPELQLDVLNVGANWMGGGTAYLASASCLRELKVLEIDRCEIPLVGARALAQAPFLDSLRRLNVNHNSFGPEGLHTLLEKQPHELHTLEIVDND